MTVRMNFGCGSVQPEDWVNVDRDSLGADMLWIDGDIASGPPPPGFHQFDVREGLPPSWYEQFDYIVANHSLSDLTFHELPSALSELYRVLKPGGVLRVLVPDLVGAMVAYDRGDASWFPQGDDLPTTSERFCTFVTWFGTVGSVFTPSYLWTLLHRAGFAESATTAEGFTHYGPPEIVSLDGDRTTSLIMEGRR
jgi:SAM-dependent methyltransferase